MRRTAADAELIASLPLDPEGRTWVRLEGPGGSEAWLIGWPPGTGTGWHDHADSVGAFATAAGELKEHSLAARLPTDGWKTLELTEGVDRERRLPAGKGRAFGQHHVHEVLNESAERARRLRPRLLPAAAADPPLQPHRPGAAPGAGRAPGGLAVSDGPRTCRQWAIDELLERVREGLDRVGAAEASRPRGRRALLVDIRYAALRERDGLIPGALVVERNELEWRLDPQGSHRAPEATSHDLRVVVVCNEGYASSLAAASLRQLGLHRATDLVGGFQAWRAAGLPVTPGAADG